MPRTGEIFSREKTADGRLAIFITTRTEKAKYHYLYASSYREVRQKKLDALAALQASGTSGITWADLSALWLREMKILVKESTYTRYERIIRCYLSPHLPKEELDCLAEASSLTISGIPSESGWCEGKHSFV